MTPRTVMKILRISTAINVTFIYRSSTNQRAAREKSLFSLDSKSEFKKYEVVDNAANQSINRSIHWSIHQSIHPPTHHPSIHQLINELLWHHYTMFFGLLCNISLKSTVKQIQSTFKPVLKYRNLATDLHCLALLPNAGEIQWDKYKVERSISASVIQVKLKLCSKR